MNTAVYIRFSISFGLTKASDISTSADDFPKSPAKLSVSSFDIQRSDNLTHDLVLCRRNASDLSYRCAVYYCFSSFLLTPDREVITKRVIKRTDKRGAH